jgi:hypothetical protein
MNADVTLLRWFIADWVILANNERRRLIPARAAIFATVIGDYCSPPMKPEIFQPPASLL